MNFSGEGTLSLVTMWLDRQRFGIPVSSVRDILKDQAISPIPRAPEEVAGSINLRGRIVTVLNLRHQLGLPLQEDAPRMFVVVEHQGEFSSLLVDKVGEVMNLPASRFEPCPPNLSSNWRNIASGIFQMQGELLIAVDLRALMIHAAA